MFVLCNALVEVLACIYHVVCITQTTLKKTNHAPSVDDLRFMFPVSDDVSDILACEHRL